MSQYDNIINKLDAFIRKFYANQLLRGSLIILAAILLYILLVTVGEYFFYFSVQMKWAILVILLGIGGSALIVWVLIPFLKMQKLGKVISHEQAAQIVGKHFPEVADKLTNLLQLRNQNPHPTESAELLSASIDQKASAIAVVPFQQAVDFSNNKKYLLLFSGILSLGIITYLVAPKIFTEGSFRLSQPSVYFAKPAPFEFKITNPHLSVKQGERFPLIVKLQGEKIPTAVNITIENTQVPMNKIGRDSFEFVFEKVHKDIVFSLEAAGYESPVHYLKLVESPELENISLVLSYPVYTQKPSEEIAGIADMSVPKGTILRWNIKAKNTESAEVNTNGKPFAFEQKRGHFSKALQFMESMPYTLILKNTKAGTVEAMQYQVQIIEDQHPQVDINLIKDTTLAQQILISGTAGDDYLITKNSFVYKVLDAQKKVIKTVSTPLKSGAQVVQFSHYFDLSTIRIAPGQQINYYVEVWDNDGINGPKSKRSQVHTWQATQLSEMSKSMQENSEKMNASMSSSAAQAEALTEEFKDLQKDLLDANINQWERMQKIQSMLDKNLQLDQNLESLQKRFEEQKRQSEAQQLSPDVLEKQEAIKEQIDQLKNKQLQEQIQKLQELLNKPDKQGQMQQMQQLEQQNKLFQMDMQRLQELMKKLELQMSMEQLADKLKDLSQKQDDLLNKTNEENTNADQLAKEQDALQKDLDKAMKEALEQMEKKNESMERPQDLEKMKDIEKQADEAKKEMSKSKEALQKDNKESSKPAQKQAKNKLAKMSESMMEMAGGMEMEQLDIDIKATRQLLTNLIRFSFDQETLMQQLKKTAPNTQKYIGLTKEQNRLKQNTSMIKDSLFSLSKRIFQIAATINKETSDLDNSMTAAITGMEARDYNTSLSKQQYAMTAANNLALLLNELLANMMQQQSSGSGSGQGGSPKPKKGKSDGEGEGTGSGKMKDIITGQQKMGKGMQQLKSGADGQEPGKQPGSKPGEGSSGQGGNGSGNAQGEPGQAETIARLAQEQAQLRKQMQELNNILNSKGMGGKVSKEIKAIQDAMDKMETDLVFRRKTDQLILRNQEIMSRMLEAEKAIQEQEEDDKRSGKAGKDVPKPMPKELSEYLKKQEALLEQHRKNAPVLKPFYQKLSETYLQKVGAQ